MEKVRVSIVVCFLPKLLAFFLLLGYSNHLLAHYHILGLDSIPTKESLAIDTIPIFPGGSAALQKFLIENIAYPIPKPALTIEQSVVVTFVVSSNGYVQNPKVIRGLNDTANSDAIRVIQRMPKWLPAIHNRQAIAYNYTLIIPYLMRMPKDQKVFRVAQIMPSFPGGSTALIRYFAENIIYPPQSSALDLQSTIIVVQLIIEADGNISNPKILKGINPAFDEAALNAVKMMPTWEPGYQAGNAVRVLYNLTVRIHPE
jgi:TonB family protein